MSRWLVATILYADIFNWPLTNVELVEWEIKGTTRRRWPNKYYFIEGRKNLVAQRKEREIWARKKWNIAKRVGRILGIIPTLKLVGVTGGLSRNNVRKDDDIDFFIITHRGSLWISRFFATIILDIFGLRRKPDGKIVANKICLNMFMDENALTLPEAERDLFSAYEVLQMQPLLERDNTYERFLIANSWVREYLPKAWKEKRKRKKEKGKFFTFYFLLFPFRLLEPFARATQLWYMQRHRTTEVIRSGVLRFHPRDARVWVRRAFASRLRRFNLPLDKFFYAS